jgi:hypothetical protein
MARWRDRSAIGPEERCECIAQLGIVFDYQQAHRMPDMPGRRAMRRLSFAV